MTIENVVIEESPDLIFIFFGANDAVDPSVKQFVPLAQYLSNLRLMVHEIRKVQRNHLLPPFSHILSHFHSLKHLPEVAVALITPPPVWEQKLEEMNLLKGKPLARDRTNERCARATCSM